MKKMYLMLAVLALALPALNGFSTEKKRPCDDDFLKYCADARDDREAMRECIDENLDNFSEACQDDLEKMKQRMEERRERREMRER
ncbi:MAG: hypothetical protein CVV44_21390 [Spirochaetae bacterium HGW-Spirochaetae-1]|jgi:hypothetical protein|nr:MAG: hypothetical protein CVV44_21390 [Spirochaetae bacterium HGW-Spirochaetae-1]